MIKAILSLLLFTTLQISAQTIYENSAFGFKMEKPESWGYYGSTEFDDRKNECHYMFFLPPKSERLSEWDNSLSFIARGNGYTNSLADVHLYERQRLHLKFDDIEVIKETKNSLLTQTTINDIQYQILTLVNYQNGISYIASYSYQSNKQDVDKLP